MKYDKKNKKIDESEAYIRRKERSYKKTVRKKDKSILSEFKGGKMDYDDYMEKMEDQY